MRMWRQLTAVSERLRTYWAVAVPLGADLGEGVSSSRLSLLNREYVYSLDFSSVLRETSWLSSFSS